MMETQKDRIVPRQKRVGAELWETFLMAFCMFLILWLLLASGCSSSPKAVKAVAPPAPSAAEIDARRLEQINRGLALFEGGHFEEAAGCFETAAVLPGGKEPIVRQSLMAAAVSRLVVNDRKGFSGNIRKIKSKYSRSDFLLLTDRDLKLRHLMGLYEQMEKER